MRCALVLALLAAVIAAAPVKPKAAHPKTAIGAGTPSTRKPTLVKTKYTTARPSTQARAGSGHRSRSRSHSRASLAPSYQLHPDPERYTQIQQALAERGYFKGHPDGSWNDESTDALKRFQTDQKLDADGKINSLTLTGLGLGPKHDGTSAASVPLSAASSSSEIPDTLFPSDLPPPPPPPSNPR